MRENRDNKTIYIENFSKIQMNQMLFNNHKTISIFHFDQIIEITIARQEMTSFFCFSFSSCHDNMENFI